MIPTLFAQADIGALKADFIKSMVIFGVAMIVVGSCVVSALVAWLQYRFDKKSSKETKGIHISPQPVEVSKASKRFNHEANERRFQSVEDKVQRHDEQISDIQEKLADELPEMERRINEAGEDRSGKIHDRINDILGEVRELRGEMRAKS